MTDTEILDEIERYANPVALECFTASVRINGKISRGKVFFRFSGGRWMPSLREAVEEHIRGGQRGALGKVANG